MSRQKYNFMSVPVGANRRFLVTCDGAPFAGFDTLREAEAFIAMQKAKKKKTKGGVSEADAASKTWAINDRR